MRITRASIVRLLAAMAVAVSLAVACGPSFRRTYQSDNAFARCFDMDYRPGVADQEKEACWQTWLKKHVYNQPGDKVRYANLRLDELAQGISVPGPPGTPGSFDQRPDLESAGTRVDASVAEGRGPDGGVNASPAPKSRVLATSDDAPGDSCEGKCGSVYSTCQSACATDAGVEETCTNACVKSRDTCLSLCAE